MPKNAYIKTGNGENDLPVELQLDLLVDGELDEATRAKLLTQLEAVYRSADRPRNAADWRALALRFLERQTEKQTVRTMMEGGAVVSQDVLSRLPSPTDDERFVLRHWIRTTRALAVAAGLLIVITGGLLALHLMQGLNPTPTSSKRNFPLTFLANPFC